MSNRQEQIGKLIRALKGRIPSIFVYGSGLYDLLSVGDDYGTLDDLIRRQVRSEDMFVRYDVASGLSMDPATEKDFRIACGLDIPLASPTGLVKDAPSCDMPMAFSAQTAKTKLSKTKQERLKTGMMDLCPELLLPLPKDPLSVFDCIRKVISNLGERPLVLFLPYADVIASSSASGIGERAQGLALLQFIQSASGLPKGSMVIATAPFPADLARPLREQRGVETITIPLPGESDRLDFLRSRRTAKSEILSRVSGGLALRDLDLLYRKNMLDPSLIGQEKSRLISAVMAELLKVKEPRFGLKDGLGGCVEIKSFFEEIIPGIRNMDPRIVPPAIIAMGPPGTGKSRLAECVSWEVGVPFVEVQSLFDPFLGVTEQNAQRVMSMLEEMAPCVAFIDEMDQNDAPRGSYVGDSGAGNRVRKTFFESIGDQRNRGKVMWMFATNRPELVDPAYKRSGRGSVRIPMLLPDDSEMKDILRVMIKQYQLTSSSADIPKIMSAIRKVQPGCISGADIEEISLSAWRKNRKNERDHMTLGDWSEAAEEFVSHEEPADGSPCEYKKMEITAVRSRSSNSLLSPRGREILKNISQTDDLPIGARTCRS